jgi:hypothetical protein
MFIETAVGVALAMIAMVAVAQLVAVLARQRSETAQMRFAALETANLMERVSVLPWDELDEETVGAIELSAEARQGLSEPQLVIAVSTTDETPPSKRIEIQLDWLDQAGVRVQPVQLVAWKFQAPLAE